MRMLIPPAAITALAIGLACGFAPGQAAARGHDWQASFPHPAAQQTGAYPDSARCAALLQQLERTITTRPLGRDAAAFAVHGAAMCQAGDFAAGADELAKAVRLVGETPAIPPPPRRPL